MWVYEDETHTFGSRLPDFYLHVADWMRDALDGKISSRLQEAHRSRGALGPVLKKWAACPLLLREETIAAAIDLFVKYQKRPLRA